MQDSKKLPKYLLEKIKEKIDYLSSKGEITGWDLEDVFGDIKEFAFEVKLPSGEIWILKYEMKKKEY